MDGKVGGRRGSGPSRTEGRREREEPDPPPSLPAGVGLFLRPSRNPYEGTHPPQRLMSIGSSDSDVPTVDTRDIPIPDPGLSFSSPPSLV